VKDSSLDTSAFDTTAAKTLEIRGLRKTYTMRGGRSVPAVRDFSLSVAPGEFVTLLGPSGCGKTTVLRTLAGLEEPDAGEILLDGRTITQLPAHRRRIGLVFQNYALFPHMTVADNVAYSLSIRKAPADAIRTEVAAALKAVGLRRSAAGCRTSSRAGSSSASRLRERW
jgi:ABC-type Fe3+/spermidine/putrescine transport system ATPase subunit